MVLPVMQSSFKGCEHYELDTHELVTIKDISECWLYEPAVSREWTIKYLGCTHLRAVSRSEDKA